MPFPTNQHLWPVHMVNFMIFVLLSFSVGTTLWLLPKCDQLSKNLASLHNGVLKMFEIHEVNTKIILCWFNYFDEQQSNNKTVKIHHRIRCLMESKNIFVSFLCHKENMSYIWAFVYVGFKMSLMSLF